MDTGALDSQWWLHCRGLRVDLFREQSLANRFFIWATNETWHLLSIFLSALMVISVVSMLQWSSTLNYISVLSFITFMIIQNYPMYCKEMKQCIPLPLSYKILESKKLFYYTPCTGWSTFFLYRGENLTKPFALLKYQPIISTHLFFPLFQLP